MSGHEEDRESVDPFAPDINQTDAPPVIVSPPNPFQQALPDEEALLGPSLLHQPHTHPHLKKKYRLGNSSLGQSFGGSAIGNKSLLGLLGGTRLLDAYTPGLGLGVGYNERIADSVLEEEGEDDYEDSMQKGWKSRDNARAEDVELAKLPPPPSAIDDEFDAFEYEDDPPPDFISRAPISPHKRRRKRTHPPASNLRTVNEPGRIRLEESMLRGGSAHNMGRRERALWRWVNVDDLDGFLQDVYLYYQQNGIWAITLSGFLNLLTVGWVIAFSTFLIGCIDYSRILSSHSLGEVVVPQCAGRLGGAPLLLVICFSMFYVWETIKFGRKVQRLWEMHEFYTHLLQVPEDDIQTIPWSSISTKLGHLRSLHPAAISSRGSRDGNTLDAHDIANRIMREENYLIALFNKELLDLSVPLPRFISMLPFVGNTHAGTKSLTRALEWNLRFCLLGFLFGPDGQVQQKFLSEREKRDLTEKLINRLRVMAAINFILSPFIVVYLLLYSFFRYFEEYHKNPSSIGSRQFTPYAKWKFREFNELQHHFQKRLSLAYPVADHYLSQFPKTKTVLVSRFVTIFAGSFAAVLILFSLIDPDAFLHFEVTPGRTVLFYIGVFGTILAVARGMIPEEHKIVYPEVLMQEIVEHTHYLPVEWKGKLHSSEVHASFATLFQMKILLFFQEVLSVIFTPYILWYSLPRCAGSIIDFFREFTIHVDGLGYVCSFAVFDFKRHGDIAFGAPVGEATHSSDRWKSKEGKMEKSFLNFTAHNPNWVPRDQTQSLYLSRMTDHSSFAPPQYPQHSRYISTRTGINSSPHKRPDKHLPTHSQPHHSQQIPVSTGHSTFGIFPSPAGPSMGKPRPTSRARPSAVARPSTKDIPNIIDEESALDGDSYIATTSKMPFGADYIEDGVVTGPVKKQGLRTILGEIYRDQRGGW